MYLLVNCFEVKLHASAASNIRLSIHKIPLSSGLRGQFMEVNVRHI